jgi:rare lipoprotein A (peptidoglycan hydrolase)
MNTILAIIALFTQGIANKYDVPRKVVVTSYSTGKYTANGERYYPNGISVAVPRLKGSRLPRHPFGSYVTLSRNGNFVRARVNDICPLDRYDLSVGGMTKLLGKYEDTKINAILVKVELPKKKG